MPISGVSTVHRSGSLDVIVRCRATVPATDREIAAGVADVLDRRGAQKHPAITLTVPDEVALAIAGLFRSPTPSGRVLERFYRTGAEEHTDLIEAARVEQGYASPEEHAALHCLIGWVHGRVHRPGG